MQTRKNKIVAFQKREIRFLLHGKTHTIIVNSETEIEFYQNKLEEINVISVKRVENKPISEISQFLKSKKSIYEGIEGF
jgi:calcineurin-like phosphoesterase family protein